MITALAGGVGAARLLRGMVEVVPPEELTAVVNTGDDIGLHGLHISPDIDTVCYTLAGLNDDERGWGLAGETWVVMTALEQLGGAAWFRLGDRDLATHLYRTQRLSEGASLSDVTIELAASLGLRIRVLPMTDDPVRTRITLAVDGRRVGFQEYFVAMAHSVAVSGVHFEGAEDARPAPGVLEAIERSEVVVICPSNPVLSIAPVLAVPGIEQALRARRDSVVAVSPIVGGTALRGPADRLLTELGEESSVTGVARRYRDVAGTLVIDDVDTKAVASIEALGVRCVVAPSVMHGVEEAAALAKATLSAGRARSAGRAGSAGSAE